MLEAAYERCLALELAGRGVAFEQQKAMPLRYKGRDVGIGYRVDLLVERQVIVEIKAIDRFESVHTAQVISYLRTCGCMVGLLFNFNVTWLADQGLKRIVLDFVK